MSTVSPATRRRRPGPLRRLGAVRRVIGAHADRPYLHGRALQLTGRAFLADALVGFDNPLGRTRRSGIGGSVIAVVVGSLLLCVVRPSLQADPYPGGTTVPGAVVAVHHGSRGTCGATVRYVAGEHPYLLESPFYSSTQCLLGEGQRLDVSYLPGDPGAGRVQFPKETVLIGMVAFAGASFLLGGSWALLCCIAGAALGAIWWRRGRHLSDGATPTPDDDLLTALRAAWSTGEVRAEVAARDAEPVPLSRGT